MEAYFSFSGRMRRTKFILLTVLLAIIQVVFYMILFAGAAFSLAANPNSLSALGPSFGFYLLFSILVLVMWFALMIKRLHDFGWSGWYSLVSLLPMVLTPFVFAVQFDPAEGLESIHYLPSMIGLGFFLVLAFAPPSPGSNRFGPDPRDPSARWDDAPRKSSSWDEGGDGGGGVDWGDDAIERALKEREAAQARQAAQAAAPVRQGAAKPAFGRR